jgi:hypothetical protein
METTELALVWFGNTKPTTNQQIFLESSLEGSIKYLLKENYEIYCGDACFYNLGDSCSLDLGYIKSDT